MPVALIRGCHQFIKASCALLQPPDAMQSAVTEKTVLVHLRERMRPVKFDGVEKDLTSAIRESFCDILSGKEEFVLQV